jgi:GntP family gluconate:H+ symporter
MVPFLLLLLGIGVVVGCILRLKLDPFLALVLAALAVGALTPGQTTHVGERLARAFGSTCASIGILIALAAVVGSCLLESGAADKVVRSALRLFGESRAPVAFAVAGFLLGIPVFFDTVFYLMVPLAKALAARTGKNYALYVMCIAGGASIAHSLVPPTPGPAFVADKLKVDMGMMILAGSILGGLSTIAGFAYAVWSNRRYPVAPPEKLEGAERDEAGLPPLLLSLLPIVLPVVLIGGDAGLDAWEKSRPGSVAPWLGKAADALGEKNTAITISAAIALGTLAWQLRGDRRKLADSVQKSLTSAGLIILVTAAGGAFGAMLKDTGIGDVIAAASKRYSIPVLPLAFFITALIRTAQGSATVAMFTAVGMLGSLADPATLGFHPVYLAAAIGFGSKPFGWMNDSGFWVVTRMAGFTPGQTIRNFSTLISIDALLGIVLTMIAAKLFPMV